MFADDMKVYQEIRTPADSAKIQVDLNALSTQSYTPALIFNGTKNLLPLCYWHEYLDMVLTHGQASQSPSVIPPILSIRTTSSSSKFTPKFTVPKCKTTTRQRSFLVRSTRIWNTLTDPLHLTTGTLSSFQSVLLNYYYTALENTFNIVDPRTFKTICTKCNQVRNLNIPITCCYSCFLLYIVLRFLY